MNSSYSDLSANKSIKTNILDILLPVIGYFTVFILLESIFEFDNGFAVGITYIIFLAFTTVCIVTKHKKFPLKAIFPLILCILTALSFCFYGVTASSSAIPFLFYFSGLYCMCLTDTDGSTFKGYVSIYRQLHAIIGIPVAKIFLPVTSLFQNRKAHAGKKRYGVIIGILCGVPVFIVVTKLLVEGDAAFSNLMKNFIEKIADFLIEFIDKIFGELSFIFVIAALFFTPYIVSVVFAFRHRIIEDKLAQSNPYESVSTYRFISPSVLSGFYGMVSLCYVIYLLSQLSYLFGAFSGNFVVSLSSYARRGFFEMSAVAFINLCLIGAGAIISKRDEKGRLSKAYKGFSVFFCLFTILLIITAMSKMGLYISSLGLTHKRIQVLLADIVLFIAFLSILIKLFKKNFPYLKITVYTMLSIICLYYTVSPDTVIAKFNTWAYLSGYHEEIDIHTLTWLNNSYQSVTSLDKIANCSDEKVSELAKSEIYNIYQKFHNNYVEYNTDFSNMRAYAFGKKNKDKISSYADSYYKYYNYYDDIEINNYPVVNRDRKSVV